MLTPREYQRLALGSAIPLRLFELFLSKVQYSDPEDCWEWTGAKHPSGYGAFGWAYRQGFCQRAHRFSWEAYWEPIPSGFQVLHRCDNRACVNPNHLFLGDHASNMLDRNLKGRQARQLGECQGQHKLTEELVREIRESSQSDREWARQLSISHMTIGRARRGRTWKHL